ncbi:ABC transporter permease [bacterium]|nr:ABC transporter permease [bacterium]
MFQNYMKIALRNLLKHKTYSAINILGLAVGIAACLLIMLYIRHELSYDRFHPDHEHLYRVTQNQGNGEFISAFTQAPFGEAVAKEFPDAVGAAVRFQTRENRLIGFGEKQLTGLVLGFADPNVFDVFGYELIKGNPKTVLANKESLVLTESAAHIYFGHDDPIGKIINVDHTTDYIVTGVMRDVPGNSHLQFDMLGSFLRQRNEWRVTNDTWTYLLLKPGITPESMAPRFAAIMEKYLSKSAAENTAFPMQRIADIHLSPDLSGEPQPHNSYTVIYTFGTIALLVLLIACINYMNLATARSSRRLKEVGMRKVLGAQRFQLVRQFLGESFLVTSAALVIGLVLAELFIPWFNNLTGKSVSLFSWQSMDAVITLAGILFFVGLIAGSYPALFLSHFQPAPILKGEIKQRSGLQLRRFLVVLQFTITVVLIVATLVAKDQIAFIQNKNLGFNKDQLINLTVRDMENWRNRTETLRAELVSIPQVNDAALAAFFVSDREIERSSLKPAAASDDDFRVINFLKCDEHLINTLQLEVLAGRAFSYQFAADSAGAFVLNETGAKLFGWTPEQAVGQTMNYNGWHQAQVVGVVKDFHFASLHKEINPLALLCWPARATRYTSRLAMTVRIRTDNLPEVIGRIEKKMNELSPSFPFEFEFVDYALQRHYEDDRRVMNLFGIFSVLAVVIACLGLLGLAAFAAEQRTKEIGVRKVLGASVQAIVALLSKDFLKLVMLGIVIAWPLAYGAMSLWLQDFAYRTELSAWTFILSAAIALAIALLTVSFQAFKAASANPVNALKYE